MLAQGIVAAYLLGILIAGTWDTRRWNEAAAACSISFLVGWVVRQESAWRVRE